mmetsp:Transcript_35990/g.49966  ORF Transcript_35990/g.49966 Transcript_35990/m.49966 type:complete len:210 (+) Transcript_35990:302-931(+)|eukprot:CAMPEP_0196593306 /NCGR_PEP_ID=MMETSP1081-20130531/75304_1 /TAXON_ID=36882 /ORGANISM="Pyramimonas amylifera, Strain CCMP720" /LENGTH=209 /DNA_ID=CAMNT_0041917257 /DNA_START=290 /DNA_END=919 /DNA_ORIENTATION=+
MDTAEFTEEEMWGFDDQTNEPIPFSHSDTTELTEGCSSDFDDDTEFLGRGRRSSPDWHKAKSSRNMESIFSSSSKIHQGAISCSLPIAVPHMQFYMQHKERKMELEDEDFQLHERDTPSIRRLSTINSNESSPNTLPPHMLSSSVQPNTTFGQRMNRRSLNIGHSPVNTGNSDETVFSDSIGACRGRNAIRARDTILRQTGFIDNGLIS